MWTCPYCKSQTGQPFQDSQFHGILCLSPDCGRVDDRAESLQSISDWDTHDV